MIKLYNKINCSLAPVLSDLEGGANSYLGFLRCLDTHYHDILTRDMQ